MIKKISNSIKKYAHTKMNLYTIKLQYLFI